MPAMSQRTLPAPSPEGESCTGDPEGVEVVDVAQMLLGAVRRGDPAGDRRASEDFLVLVVDPGPGCVSGG
jgi:hypothetical protein